MKKYLVIIVAVFTVANVNAQEKFSIGIKVGQNFTSVNNGLLKKKLFLSLIITLLCAIMCSINVLSTRDASFFKKKIQMQKN